MLSYENRPHFKRLWHRNAWKALHEVWVAVTTTSESGAILIPADWAKHPYLVRLSPNVSTLSGEQPP
jgi:hypothetical protein